MKHWILAPLAALALSGCAAGGPVDMSEMRANFSTPLPAPSRAEFAAADHGEDKSQIEWAAYPTAEEIRYVYPPQAQAIGMEGAALLDCIVQTDGAVACAISLERPPYFSFGEAARLLSTRLRAAPQDNEGRSTVGRWVRVPFYFLLTENHSPGEAPALPPLEGPSQPGAPSIGQQLSLPNGQ